MRRTESRIDACSLTVTERPTVCPTAPRKDGEGSSIPSSSMLRRYDLTMQKEWARPYDAASHDEEREGGDWSRTDGQLGYNFRSPPSFHPQLRAAVNRTAAAAGRGRQPPTTRRTAVWM